MIIGKDFIIPHIPRTGGDALKAIIKALDLPVVFYPINSPEKHRKPTREELESKELILTFRKLVDRERSFFNFHLSRGDELFVNARKNPGKFLLERGEGEKWLHAITYGGEFLPSRVIRCEFLLIDAIETMREFFEITPDQERRALATVTKPRGVYPESSHDWFEIEDVLRLYSRSPLWAELERAHYSESSSI